MKKLLFILLLFSSALNAQTNQFHFKHGGLPLQHNSAFFPNYGMFVLSRVSPPLTTLAQKIHRVDSCGLKWYRENFVYMGGTSLTNEIGDIQQIQDSGLNVELTINFTQSIAQGGSGLFISDTALEGRILDTLLAAAPPQLMLDYNEPSTSNFWIDTSINYIPTMICMNAHAIPFNVPVSTYTTTTTGVFALYNYYTNAGLTDSLTWLQGVSGIGSISGPVAQHAINFFTTVMPVVATLNSFATDMHYYAPYGSMDTDTTWNDLFRVYYHFIATNSGNKQITVTEFGTDNNSQYLLNHFLDAMFNLQILYQFYFDGDNSGDAVNLTLYYIEYINNKLE